MTPDKPFQFGLRSLFALTTVVAILLAVPWLGLVVVVLMGLLGYTASVLAVAIGRLADRQRDGRWVWAIVLGLPILLIIYVLRTGPAGLVP